MIQLITMDQVSLGLAHQLLGLGFIIWCRFELEVLGDRFPPVHVGVGRPGNNHYIHPGLPDLTSWPDWGSPG
jgi:hypothetical protein